MAYVTVPDRNRILVHRVFRAHPQVQQATALSFCLGRSSYALRGRIRYSCIYIARMSPTLSGNLALQHVKLGDALEIRNGTIFDFYLGLPHIEKGWWLPGGCDSVVRALAAHARGPGLHYHNCWLCFSLFFILHHEMCLLPGQNDPNRKSTC